MPSLASGNSVLHGLREHVRGRVPQHRAAVLGVDRHRLDLVAVRAPRGTGPAVSALDPGHDHGPVGEQLGGRGPLGADRLARRGCRGGHGQIGARRAPGARRAAVTKGRPRWARRLRGAGLGLREPIGAPCLSASG